MIRSVCTTFILLCSMKLGCTSEKLQINLFFRSVCTNFNFFCELKVGCISEFLKIIWKFIRFTLPLQPISKKYIY